MDFTMISAVIVNMVSIPSMWDMIKPFIEKCDGHISSADDLYPLLVKGERHATLVILDGKVVGVCIWRAVKGFQYKALITTLGGDAEGRSDLWNVALDDFASQLKVLKFDRIEIQGRKGWTKLFPDFNEMHTTIGREL
jgi:hypothetical protein